MIRSKQLIVGIAAFGLIGLIGCGSDDDDKGGGAGTPKVTVIKLAQNAWLSSEVNNEIARKIMTEELGLTVEIVDEGASEQFAIIAEGELHACLEIWASGRKDQIANFVKTGKVENGGDLGPVGKIGWFTPTYMVQKYPSLATWEGLKDPDILAEFRTPETGDKGRFLGAVEGYSSYDDQIIPNLDLDLEIIRATSEDDALTQLKEAYDAQRAILMYWWMPHSSHAIYDMSNVLLPEHNDECYAKSDDGGVDCDYPTDYLFKIFWPELKTEAPEAYNFLKAMKLTTKDHVDIMAAVDYDGKTVEEACSEWLAANESTWRSWLP